MVIIKNIFIVFLLVLSNTVFAVEKKANESIIVNELNEFKQYLDNKIEAQTLDNQLTFYISIGALLISILAGVAIFFATYILSAKKTNVKTEKEGRKVRKKLRSGFNLLTESSTKISNSNKEIKNDTAELRKLSDSIHFKLQKIFEIKSNSSFKDDIELEFKKYETIINRLEVKNSDISSKNNEIKLYTRELIKTLKKNNKIETALSEMLSNQATLNESIGEIKGFIIYNQESLNQLVSQSVDKQELVYLLNNSIDELVITRNKNIE